MKAELGIYPKDRQLLCEILPLNTPLSVDFYISNVCNFKCNYCLQSKPQPVFDSCGLRKEFMSWEIFQLAVKQAQNFPSKIKQVAFTGFGEPTLHKLLPEMIRSVRDADIAETIMVITNASTLTSDLTHRLVDAGLDVLRISLQGLSAAKYKEISDVSIDWDQFYNNLIYFSKARGNCKLKIKIADTALEEGDEERFFELFGDLADAVAVEHIYDVFSQRGKVWDVPLKKTQKNRYGLNIRKVETCWIPFIRMAIQPNGITQFCCDALFGFEQNIQDVSLFDQWNGIAWNQARKSLLEHDLSNFRACQVCHAPSEQYHPEDILDGHEEEILNRMRAVGLLGG